MGWTAMVSGLLGLGEGNKGFHYTILSAFVHVQHFLCKNLKKKKKTIEVVAKERKKKVEKGKIQPVK